MEEKQEGRVDLRVMKGGIAKRLGVEKFRKYLFYLNYFLRRKLRKTQFDKLCFRILGKENIALHNQLISSIFKNACSGVIPPSNEVGLLKADLGSGTLKQIPDRPNGVLLKSGIHERKREHGPKLLVENGKIDHSPHVGLLKTDVGLVTLNQAPDPPAVFPNGVPLKCGIHERKPEDRPDMLVENRKTDHLPQVGLLKADDGLVTLNQISDPPAILLNRVLLGSGVHERKLEDRPGPPLENVKNNHLLHTGLVNADMGFVTLNKITTPLPSFSNGVLSSSESHGRRLEDRPNPLAQNRKIDHLPCVGTQADVDKVLMGCKMLSEHQEGLVKLVDPKHTMSDQRLPALVDVEDVIQEDCRRKTPLGTPFFSKGICGLGRYLPISTHDKIVSSFDSGLLSDTKTLKRRMEEIAVANGIEGVSTDCANLLNNMIDLYLKRLIKPCIEMVEARSVHEHLKQDLYCKLRNQGNPLNGTWPTTNSHTHINNGHHQVSLLDLKVSMELNPKHLGKNWPLRMDEIGMRTFEE